MTEPKSGWPRVRFGDVVRQVKDKVDPESSGLERYIAGEHMDTDDLRIRRWGEIGDGYLGPAFYMRFKPGHVLYGSRRTYLRKVAVPDFEGICANTTFVLESKDHAVLLPDLLPFLMQTEAFNEYSVLNSKGSVNPYINFSDLAQYEFALPPLAEQRRIAGVLETTDATVNNCRRLVDTTRNLWNAVAANYFSETGLAYQDMQRNSKKLGNYLEYASDGPFGSKLKTEHYTESGVRVIRLQNIDPRSFNDDDKAYISDSYYQGELTGYTVYPGDVLIAGLGDERISPGRACVTPSYLGFAINKADCYCLRPSEGLDARYLVCFLNSLHGLRQSMAFTQGTTRYRLNLGNIKRMSIPLPNKSIQQEIADTLEAIQSAEETAISRYEGSNTLKKSLLSSLLGDLQ